jgi:DNA-binding NarL/FixJ family response regulator
LWPARIGEFTGRGAPTRTRVRAVLYGRATESALLDQLLDGAREAQGGVLVLRGEPGIGKSALLDDAVASADGFRVLRGWGVESECKLPFAALHRIIQPVLDHSARIPPIQEEALRGAMGLGGVVDADRFLTSLALLTLLAEVAEERPLLCLVDDADWLDEESADALVFVARRLLAEPVALVLAARGGDGRSMVPTDLPTLTVDGLDLASSLQVLAEAAGSQLAPEIGRRLAEGLGGNPLALREVPPLLTADQLAGRTPLPDPLPVGAAVEVLFLDRVRRMPEPTRTVLLVAAVDDTGDTSTVLAAARSLGASAKDLESAERAGLVRFDEHVIAFHHPLVRSAVYQWATFTRRQATHLALAEALIGASNADRRAWHRAAAAVGPSEGVADELERSADRARRRNGHVAAAAALERAAELTGDEARRARRFTAAAESAWRGGRPERALGLVKRAEALMPESRLRADLQHLRGVIELRCGTPAEGCTLLLAGADDVATTDPRKALDMLFDAGEAATYAGDVAAAIEAGRRVDELPVVSQPSDLVTGLLTGVASLLEGRSAASSARVADAVARAELFDNPRWLAWAGTAAGVTGQDRAEYTLHQRANALARTSAAVTALTSVLEAFGFSGVMAGRYSAVAADADEGLRLAREAGFVNSACYHLATLALVAAVRGREDECLAYATEVTGVASAHGLGLQNAIAEWARALLDLGVGRFAESTDRLERLTWGGPGTKHPFVELMATPDLVEAAARGGRPEAAQEAHAGLERFTDVGAPRWALAVRSRCRGLLSAGVAAERHFEEALRLHAGSQRSFDRARTELAYAEHIRRGRRRIQAREHLRVAIDEFDRLGADPWAERARNELRATGETARRRELDVSDELTPQELQVARLVAEGGTNKDVAAHLFLSPRTVDYHLRKVFLKLGISSRSELMVRPSRLGWPDG